MPIPRRSTTALAQLRDKLRALGSGDVIVHRPHAGFNRFRLSNTLRR
jgi:hypothetical protein